jgi:hypothetical protein
VGELVTRARWTVNSASARNVQLKKLKSYSETDDSTVELAYNTADDGPVGVIDKPGGGALELEYYREQGARPEVDWVALKAAKEFFSLTRQDVSGQRWQYTRCRVANVASDGDDSASHMQKIQVVWSERKQL